MRRRVSEGSSVRIRDAAEEAWSAVVSATDAVLLSTLGKKPSSRWEGRRLLRELEKTRKELEYLNLGE